MRERRKEKAKGGKSGIIGCKGNEEKQAKSVRQEVKMYKHRNGQMTVDDFILPFSGELLSANRWVRLASLVPWDEFEKEYSVLFGEVGNLAKPARMALGSLLIQVRLGMTDEETVQQISENAYMQYFIGLHEYQTKAPFDASMMVHFRKRITPEMLAWINEEIRKRQSGCDTPKNPPGDNDGGSGGKSGNEPAPNSGKLILDATCAPQDIRYPTDVNLLNEAREKLEGMIDRIWKQATFKDKKPRTYRECARRAFLKFIKRRKPSRKKIRSAIRAQLGYVNRDLQIVDQLLIQLGIDCLSDAQIEQLITIHRLYAQQQEMYTTKTHRVDQCIVSISQPHVRPIVRGKAGRDTEFGAKILVSMVNGHAAIERLSWENFNEGGDLIECVESYRKRYGFYPEVVLADKLFRTRANLAFCKSHGIRLSGPPLGRPKTNDHAQSEKIQRMDSADRNAIEGEFGQGKRRYGLDCIMTKLKHTSEVSILLQFLVMNLTHYLRLLFSFSPESLLY
jgi:hypothetical protein